LVDRYGLTAVWRAVAAVIDADPSMLDRTYTRAQLDQRAADRKAAADALDQQAAQAYQAGDYDRALALVGEAEQVAPDHRDWDGLREFVRKVVAPEGT
jgi:hypothetical protein